VRLWDAATGEAVADLPHGGNVRALALSPDGKRLVAMGDLTDGLRVWDVASRRPIGTYQTAENRLWAVAYRPGGAHIAVLGPGHVIEVLDAATGQRVATADAGARLEYWAYRRALAYSPDGRLLAGPYEGNRVGLWEADTYRLVGTLTGHEGTVLSVAFSADGRLLASGGADSLIKVWDVASRGCRRTLQGHADVVFAAVFHPDGSRIASGGATAWCACGTRRRGRSSSGCPDTPTTSTRWPSAPTARHWCRVRATPPCGCGTPSR
jgi:WD40 repeat protein